VSSARRTRLGRLVEDTPVSVNDRDLNGTVGPSETTTRQRQDRPVPMQVVRGGRDGGWMEGDSSLLLKVFPLEEHCRIFRLQLLNVNSF